MLRPALLPFIVLGGTLTACVSPEESDEPRHIAPVGEASDAIKGGYFDDVDTAAVGIVEVDYGGICSGSLIAPNLVLTARHCVSQTLGGDDGVHCLTTSFGPPFRPQAFYVTSRSVMSQNLNNYRAVAEVVPLPVADNLFCGQDMALLILQENFSDSIVPYVPRVDQPLVAGEQYYAIGYGNTSESAQDAGERRRRDGLFVNCAAAGCGEQSYLRVTEWVGDTGICSGDSGGPAIDMLNRVIGVTSRGAYNCDDPVYGDTQGWGQWIKDTAARAATMGGYPPAPWVTGAPTDPQYGHPVGTACADGTTCPSGICFNSICTRSCADWAPCPEGFACEAPPEAGGGFLCVVPTTPPPEPPPDPEEEEEDDDGGGKKKSKKSGGDDAAAPEAGGCAIGVRAGSEKDPVNPVPWLIGAAVLAGGLGRRRRR